MRWRRWKCRISEIERNGNRTNFFSEKRYKVPEKEGNLFGKCGGRLWKEEVLCWCVLWSWIIRLLVDGGWLKVGKVKSVIYCNLIGRFLKYCDLWYNRRGRFIVEGIWMGFGRDLRGLRVKRDVLFRIYLFVNWYLKFYVNC